MNTTLDQFVGAVLTGLFGGLVVTAAAMAKIFYF